MAPPAIDEESNQKKQHQQKTVQLSSLVPGTTSTFWGRIAQFKSPSKSRGDDFFMSMVLEDDSICSGGEADKGLLVNFFNRQVSCLPQVEQVGQIIECRRFKLQSYQNRVQAISTNYCSFSVFAPSANGKGWSVKRSHEKAVEPSEEEIEICNSLFNNNNATTSTSMLSSSRPSLRVEDIKTQNTYFDWVAQVVKGPLEGDKNVETYILTDFTKSPFEAYCRIDSVNLPSSILVPVTFWDNYADEARLCLREGMVVRVENLRSKLVNNSLSFVLHGDPSQIRKITICQQVPSDFEQRRQSYIATDPSMEQQDNIIDDDVVSCEKPLINKDAFLSQRPTVSYTIKLTKGLGIPSTPIKTILSVGAKELPAKFIVSCRIKETTPSDYASFSHPKCTFCGRVTSVRYNARDNGGDGKARCTICKRARFTPTSWGWMFSFLLEDSAFTSLPVLFLQEDAEKFLSGLRATDLEKDLESLERLEDIMSSLVGSDGEGGGGGSGSGSDQNTITNTHLLCIRAASGAPGGIKYRICNSIVVRRQ